VNEYSLDRAGEAAHRRGQDGVNSINLHASRRVNCEDDGRKPARTVARTHAD